MRSQTHHLVVVPDGGPLTGLAVGLSPRNAPQGSHLVLHVGPPSRRIPVRTVVLDRASDDVVIIGEALAARFDVDPNSTWSLESLAVVGANRITIELPVEQDLDAATNSIVNGGLPAQALLVGPDADSQYVDVNGIPYRVTAVEAPVRASESLVVVRPETRVDLFSPTVRTGVDIVILADTSGSMGAQDIPGPVEGLFAQRSHLITRMQALKSSLNALVDLRLETSGRISRIALVEFDGTTHHKFPRQGGMIELDGQSPRLLVEEFRTAVATMTPEGGTNIANALHEAANLLYRHGHPGNERLIVLISDGAHWTPKGEDAAGELIGGVDDPLTLLTHLHRETGIKMLGLGIGTKALFDAAYGRTQYAGNHTLVPDHELLIQLSKVTGIDPSVGGIAEFTKFFTELGSGLVQPVRGPLRVRHASGPLSDEAVRLIDNTRHRGATAAMAERESLAEIVYEAAGLLGKEYESTQKLLSWRRLDNHIRLAVVPEPGSAKDGARRLSEIPRLLRVDRAQPAACHADLRPAFNQLLFLLRAVSDTCDRDAGTIDLGALSGALRSQFLTTPSQAHTEVLRSLGQAMGDLAAAAAVPRQVTATEGAAGSETAVQPAFTVTLPADAGGVGASSGAGRGGETLVDTVGPAAGPTWIYRE